MGDPHTNSRVEKAIDRNLQLCTEDHRFWLAVVIVIGFLLVLLVAMVGEFADPPTLAGIFSGWIVAIIGFYFIEQASDRTQQQAIQITGQAQRRLGLMAEKNEETAEELMRKTKEKIEKLEKEKNAFRDLAEEYRKMVKDAISESTDSPK